MKTQVNPFTKIKKLPKIPVYLSFTKKQLDSLKVIYGELSAQEVFNELVDACIRQHNVPEVPKAIDKQESSQAETVVRKEPPDEYEILYGRPYVKNPINLKDYMLLSYKEKRARMDDLSSSDLNELMNSPEYEHALDNEEED